MMIRLFRLQQRQRFHGTWGRYSPYMLPYNVAVAYIEVKVLEPVEVHSSIRRVSLTIHRPQGVTNAVRCLLVGNIKP